MCNWACDFDAQNTSDAKEKSEDTSYEAAPEEKSSIPCRSLEKVTKRKQFSAKDEERQEHSCRASVRPVRQLYSGIVAVLERRLDQHSVESNKERGQDAVSERQQRWRGIQRKVF